MKTIYNILLLISIIISPFITNAQANILKFENEKKSKSTFNFKLVNNLIIIPVIINQSDTLNFILDTGLKTSLITNLPKKDSSMLKLAQKYTIKGLGIEGNLDVFLSYGNKIRMNGIVCNNYNFYIITDDKFNLSGELGMNIHGLIGADIFENFIVKINYSNNTLTFFDPQKFKYPRKNRNSQEMDLEISKSKPYINLNIKNEKDSLLKVKLLIDTGSGDALWLFDETNDEIIIPQNKRYTFLGKGLSGKIFGFQARTKQVNIGKHSLCNVSTSFPDSTSILNSFELDIIGRNGSIGAEMLRRFDIIFDYPNKKITLTKNKNFKDEFNFNMGGMEVQSIFGTFPIYRVSYILKNSPADLAGLRFGDNIIKINGESTFNYSVIEINSFMRLRQGKKISIVFLRGGVEYKTSFRLRKDI
jgi:hypothetical protein